MRTGAMATGAHAFRVHPHVLDTPERLRQVMGAEFTYSEEQFAAISAPLAPGVIIAGAGSGKTEVMAARVVYLVATGQVEPGQVLGLTFTTKAAGELANRIRASLRKAGYLRPLGGLLTEGVAEPLEPTVSTYNAYAAAILAEHGLRIGHEPDTRVMADASRYQLAARAIARHRGRVEHLSDSLATVIGYVLQLDAQMAEHLVSPHDLRRWQAAELPRWLAAELGTRGGRGGVDGVVTGLRKREEVLGLVEDYRWLKSELGLMDFSDQIARAARLALDFSDVGRLEREKFAVVLLDEYQDTSVAQARMLSALFSGPPADAAGGETAEHSTGRGHPVLAVGDPNQAIYGWRGASVSNIVNFSSAFPAGPDSATPPRRSDDSVFRLTVNRRSDRRILAAANNVARALSADERIHSSPLQARDDAGQGEVSAALLETYADELGFLVQAVKEAHADMRTPLWSELGVLTRDNAHAADIYDALVNADIPVEIVGINGLLRLPEVAEIVATLQLLHDLTANAALLTLLSGPRWAIGVRDLALLGRRAKHVARGAGAPVERAPGASGPGGPSDPASASGPSLADELNAVVAGRDPTEAVSLNEALEDLGPAGYSAEARERFALLAAELRHLRGFVGEPLLDLVRRIVDVTGVELEIASSASRSAPARLDNLDAFVRAVADFTSLDGQVSLPALLAYLQAEDEMGNGLDAASPSVADSVKLLTVHRAKGLEWDVVFLPGVCETKFPNTQGRITWLRGPGVLPFPLRGDSCDLPDMDGYSEAAVKCFPQAVRAGEQTEQLRLGYVAFTRARSRLVVSGHWWKPGRKGRLGPSPYLSDTADSVRSWGGSVDPWCPEPVDGAVNPVLKDTARHLWPMEPDSAELTRRQVAAAAVHAAIAAQRGQAASPQGQLASPQGQTASPQQAAPPGAPMLSEADARLVAEWDQELERLLTEVGEAGSDVVEVRLPSSLSATSLASLRNDPDRFAADLARPLPRRPSPAARFGTRFHAWLESRFGQLALVDLDEVPGRGDVGIEDDDDLEQLIAAFTAGPFAHRQPVAVEPPFALVLGGQVVRGRIDAVFETATGFLVVDWKTSRTAKADRLQLALYRLAWAELKGIPVEQVEAGFYFVRHGRLETYDDLPDREALTTIIRGKPGAETQLLR